VMPFSSAASRAGHRHAIVIWAVAANVDDAPQPAIGILFEERHGEINRTGNRSAGAPANRRFHAAATASADSGPSITRQGMIIFWSLDADHSK